MKLIYAILVIAVIGIVGYLYLNRGYIQETVVINNIITTFNVYNIIPNILSGDKYPYETVISGVKINSEIPLEEIQNYKTIALLNSSNNAAITCNFELSAISIREQSSRNFDNEVVESESEFNNRKSRN